MRMKDFVVDVYTVDSNLKVRKQRLDAGTLEEAMEMMEIRKDLTNVTRMVVSERTDGGKHLQAVKVYTSPFGAS